MESIKKDLVQNVTEAARLSHLSHVFDEKFMNSLSGDAESYLEVNKKVTDFSKKLFDKYGYNEVVKRQLFHVIAHSNLLTHAECPYFDFEGENSIEKFIEEL